MQELSARASAAKLLGELLTRNKQPSLYSKSGSQKIETLNQIDFSKTSEPSFIQQLCYGVMRWHEQLYTILSLLLKKTLKEKDLDIQALLLMGLFQIIHLETPEHAALHATVEAAKELKKDWATSFINAVLRNFLRQKQYYLNEIEKIETAKYSHPQWLLGKLKKAWPQDWQKILIANNIHPPLVLRVNQRKNNVENYLQLLKENNIPAELSVISPDTIILDKPCSVDELPGFQDGLVSVQDTAAQLAAYLLELKDGQIVLDACAAPGGKTAHILELKPTIKKIIAVDIDDQRLKKISGTLDRLELTEKCELICADAAQTNTWWNGEKLDRILIDAPCSATGVIRRHPDIKYLRQPEDIELLTEKQITLLNNLWSLLKLDGILLYATCSVLPQENNKVIQQFLSNHSDAEEIIIAADWGVSCEYGRQILAGMHNMDGFYYAKIRKKCNIP